MASKLESLCILSNEKITVSKLDEHSYISTENMLPNRGGITQATTLPSTKYTQAFHKGDVLVSNIRPYFKKVWQAEFDGGCSNDVLVFRASDTCDADFLFYVLSSNAFFDYATATSKGTKMPRGDKKAIMQFVVPDFDIPTQRQIATLPRSIDIKITTIRMINDNLSA